MISKKDLVGWIGIIVCISSILLGLYLGLWVCIVGGVAAVINGFQSDPWNGIQIGMGVLRFLSASIVGMFSFFVGYFSGLGIIGISDNMED